MEEAIGPQPIADKLETVDKWILPECHDDDQGDDGALQEALADARLLWDN